MHFIGALENTFLRKGGTYQKIVAENSRKI